MQDQPSAKPSAQSLRQCYDLAFGDILQAADLEPDRIYDVRELGAEAGQLTIYIDDETVRVDRAAEILLELKRMLEQGGRGQRLCPHSGGHSRQRPRHHCGSEAAA